MSAIVPPLRLPLLLAFDLDGTLIPDRGETLPADTVTALACLRALGVKLAIITGRDAPPRAVLEAMQPHAVAGNNGGRIVVDGALHSEAQFTPADLEAVLAHELEGARVVLFTANGLFVDVPPGFEPEEWMMKRGYGSLGEAPREGILKVGFYHLEVAGFADRLRGTHPHLVLTGAQEPYPHFLTVTPQGAHKGAALLLIADALSIPHAQTAAFGDSDNDQAMLEVAGYAVQVGTLPLLAPHADVQIASHAELGALLNAWADQLEADQLET